jgi:hypothetical protein
VWGWFAQLQKPDLEKDTFRAGGPLCVLTARFCS